MTLKDLARRAVLVALGVSPLLSALSFAEEATAPPPPEQREVWVPANRLQSILEKHPNAVVLSREQYETLLRDSRPDPKTKVTAPRPVVLSEARYEARATGKVVVVEGELTVHLLTDEWTQLLLNFDGLTLGEIRVDGEAALVPEATAPQAAKKEAASSPITALLLRGRGERKIRVSLSTPVTLNGGLSKIGLRLPPAPVNSFHLTLPPGQRVTGTQPIRIASTAVSTEVTAGLQPTNPTLGLIWRGVGETGRSLAPTVLANGLYTIDAEKVRGEYGFSVTTQLGNLPTSFRVTLGEGVKVLQVTGDELARWEMAGPQLVVTLQPGERTTAKLWMAFELPSLAAAPKATLTLPVPRIEGLPRMQGIYSIAGDRSVTVKDIAVGDTARPFIDDGSTSADTVASYRFIVPPVAPRVAVERALPRFFADLDTRVEFKSEAIFIERTITPHAEKGEVFQTAVTLPAGEEVLTVQDATGAEPDWRMEGGRVRLRWSEGDIAGPAPVFKIQSRIEPPKWTQLGVDGLTFALGDAQIEGAEKITGYIALQSEDAFRLEAEPSETLERRDGRTTPVKGDHAWFRRQDFALNIKIARRPAEVLAQLTGYALPLEGILDLHAQLDFQFLHSGTRSVRIQVPEKIAQNFYFDGPQIAERNLAGDIWTIVFQKELTGAYALKVTAQVPVEKTDAAAPAPAEGAAPASEKESRFRSAVPVITALDAVRSSGVWAIEANTETEITFEAKGLNELDSLLAPRLPDYQPRHRVIGVFAWMGSTYELTLSGVRHAAATMLSSVVDQLNLDTVVSTSGVERNQASFQLRTAGAQYLDVTLPEKSRLLSLTVDDELVKPVGDRPGQVRVQLQAKRDANQALNVTIFYETPKGEWRRAGGYTARAPRLAPEIPILQSRWQFFLPEGFEYTALASNLQTEKTPSIRPLILAPLTVYDEVFLPHMTVELPPDFTAEDGSVAAMKVPSSQDAVESSPQFRANVEKVKQFFIEAQGFYDTGRFALAKKRCEQILNLDPHNLAAQKFVEKIDRAINEYGAAAYNEMRADAIRQTDLAWSRPVRRFDLPIEIPPLHEVEMQRMEKIQRKLVAIVIPKLELQDATIREAIEFLKKKSVELDAESPAGEKGVNMVLKLDGDFPPSPNQGEPARITVSLTNIPLVEALRYVTGLANLKFKVEPYAISIVPNYVSADVAVTKEWRVPPEIFGTLSGENVDRETAKKWLTAQGVAFAGVSSAIFIQPSGRQKMNIGGNGSAFLPVTGRLIVRNTQDQIDLIETILGSVDLNGRLTAPVGGLMETQREAGLLPMRIELPKSGRMIVFNGLAAAEQVEFQYEDWWSRARRLWLWFVCGAFGFVFLSGSRPWWRTAWVVLLFTVFPLAISPGTLPICNALLGGWLVALVIMRLAARLVFTPQPKEVLA